MFDYSKNGIFGEVEYYRSAAYIDHFKSVDRIVVSGWHNVNDLYYFDWKKGVKKTSLLIFTLEGRGFLNIDGKKYNLLPGTLAIIPADMPAYYATEKNCHWTFQWIHYCGRHAEAVTTDTVRFGGYVLELKEQENVEIMRYMKQMTDSRLTGLEKLISESEVVDGILHIAVKRAIVPNYGESKKTLSEEIAFGIESASEFSISELSKNYHYSPEHIIRVGYDYNLFDFKGYRNVALYAEEEYRGNKEKYVAALLKGIDDLAGWAKRSKKPLITTECWAITDYKDGPLLNWGWVLELNRIGVEAAIATGCFAAVATSNFCGPQFAGMWREKLWHKDLTEKIKNSSMI